MPSVREKPEVSWEMEQGPSGGKICPEVLLVLNFGGCNFTSSNIIPLQRFDFKLSSFYLSFQVITFHCNHHLTMLHFKNT